MRYIARSSRTGPVSQSFQPNSDKNKDVPHFHDARPWDRSFGASGNDKLITSSTAEVIVGNQHVEMQLLVYSLS
ncbi:hypothetical protein DSO57_1019336 [Entomophthora muscae]|uniref:Uncharacterized protein n=1 Tax=Entomophthora muscae TaxID=34485 RepID=A0ACC2SH45_9FUNG|nr:hypothetical protein DSO57_1019336 [Entomophthora muscae]